MTSSYKEFIQRAMTMRNLNTCVVKYIAKECIQQGSFPRGRKYINFKKSLPNVISNMHIKSIR